MTERMLPEYSCVAAWLGVLGLACSPEAEAPPPPPPPAAAVQAPAAVMAAIVAVNVTWGDHYNRGEAAALTAMYAPDAVVMTRDGDAAGAEAIRRHFERLFTTRRDTVLASNVSTQALDVAGDRAYEAGTVTYSLASKRNPGASRREVRVRYINFWQMTPEGRWLIRRSLRTE